MNWLQDPTYSASMMGIVKPLKFMHLKSKTIIGARMNLELKLKKLIRIAFKVELVSKELNHFGLIAGLFRQIGGHSSRFVLFCSF